MIEGAGPSLRQLSKGPDRWTIYLSIYLDIYNAMHAWWALINGKISESSDT